MGWCDFFERKKRVGASPPQDQTVRTNRGWLAFTNPGFGGLLEDGGEFDDTGFSASEGGICGADEMQAFDAAAGRAKVGI